MRRFILIVSMLSGFQVVASGADREQEQSQLRFSLGYGNAFRGFPGALRNHSVQGGMQLVWARGFGVGVEGGLHGVCNHCDFRGSFAANGYYHFRLPRHLERLEPFVTAGYTVALGPGTNSSLFNFGAGINLWLIDLWSRQDTAVRVEIRDHLSFDKGAHFPEIRIGLAFR